MTADYPGIHNRSLFQLGDWHIVKSVFSEGMLNECFALHVECTPTKWDITVDVTKDNICYRCGDAVPDELQGLLAMYYWETR